MRVNQMKKTLFLLSLLLPFSAQAKAELSDSQVKQLMIQDSIASYSGHCPCPYNVASNGSSCGRRSAYLRPGGAAPLCYERDISKQMVDSYRKNFRL